MEPPPEKEPRAVVCIGDIHGHITKLTNLWSNLRAALRRHIFSTALVIFLGDYCDRGPSTRHVIDFLSSLPSLYPHQTHVFLSGNHDFAFSAFIGVLPRPAGGYDFAQGWREFGENKEREGWYDGEGYEEMHVQGRRWAGKIVDRENLAKGTVYLGSIYDARPTFESYSVEHGSAGRVVVGMMMRDGISYCYDLKNIVPEEHKKFLADLVWVHEEDDVTIETPDGIKHCRLIAVHAGLEKGKDVVEQLRILKARDTRVPKIAALSGRKNVWDIPEELTEQPTIVVSGHHGKLHIEGLRLIIDEGGGLEQNPIAAVVLPSLKIIRDTDVIVSQNPNLL